MKTNMRGLFALAAALATASGCAETEVNGLGGAGGATIASTSTGGAATGGNSAVGGGGSAPCDPAEDHSSDALNCGSCGHDCLGGACTAGQCQPVVLLTGKVWGPLAVDDMSIYWTYQVVVGEGCATSEVERAPKLASVFPVSAEVVTPTQSIPLEAHVKDGYLYYGGMGCQDHPREKVTRFPVDASNPTVDAVATLSVWAGIAPGAAALYAMVATTQRAPFTYDIVSMPLAGGQMTTLATNQAAGQGLMTDDVNIYWSFNGDILSVPVSGGMATILVSGASFGATVGTGFAADGALYYMVVGAPTTSVWRLAAGDVAPGQMIWQSDMGQLGGIIESGDDVCYVLIAPAPPYLTSIGCAAKDGSDPTGHIVVPNPGIMDSMAADDRAIYWTQTNRSGPDEIRTLQRVVK